jgi:prephenate dehydrogenase
VSESELLAQPVVIFCVTISAFDEVLGRTATRIRPGSLVMDTCSVKELPVRAMLCRLPAGISVLGTHPLFGPDSAAGGLEGMPIVLCPARVAEADVQQWRGWFASLGLTVHVMDPEEHDRQAAWTQGVTHYIGRVLNDLGIGPSPIATVGYRRLLEIVAQTCNDPWQLFLDLQRYNPRTREMRSRLRESLDRVLSAIGELDTPEGGSYDRATDGGDDG